MHSGAKEQLGRSATNSRKWAGSKQNIAGTGKNANKTDHIPRKLCGIHETLSVGNGHSTWCGGEPGSQDARARNPRQDRPGGVETCR